jgi:hypothetical protein
MSISRKPKQPSEAEIKTLIEKGGSVAKVKTKSTKTDVKNVQLRLINNVISEIDDIRNKSMVAPSRHAWILTAIKEKLERDK